MIEITPDQLLAKIGALTLQVEHLQAENERLLRALAEQQAAEEQLAVKAP